MEVHDQAVQIAEPVKALALEEREIPLAVDRVRRSSCPATVTQACDRIWIHVPRRPRRSGLAGGEAPKQAQLSRALIKALKRAHQVLDAHLNKDGVMPQSPSSAHERNLVRLAWLAPDVQLAFLEGRQKPGVCLEDLRCAAIPLCWEDQGEAYVACCCDPIPCSGRVKFPASAAARWHVAGLRCRRGGHFSRSGPDRAGRARKIPC